MKKKKKFDLCKYCKNKTEAGCMLNIRAYGDRCSSFGPCFGARGNFKKYTTTVLSKNNNSIPSYVRKAYENHYLQCMKVFELIIEKYFLVVNMGKIFSLNGITEENKQLDKVEKLMEIVMSYTINQNTYITEELEYVCIDEVNLNELGKQIEEAITKNGFDCTDCIGAYPGFYAKGNPISKKIDDLLLCCEKILLG